MATTDCERNVRGIPSIKEGHWPLWQHAFQTKGKSGLGFPLVLASEWKCLLLTTPLLGCNASSGGMQGHFHTRGKGQEEPCPLGHLALAADSVLSCHIVGTAGRRKEGGRRKPLGAPGLACQEPC